MITNISWTTIYGLLASSDPFLWMNQPQSVVIAWRGCRTAHTEGREATHPSWTKAPLFPPSNKVNAMSSLSSRQRNSSLWESPKHTVLNFPWWWPARLNREALFLWARTSSLRNNRAPAPQRGAVSDHTQTLEQDCVSPLGVHRAQNPVSEGWRVNHWIDAETTSAWAKS